jgi:hypothetical protein
MTRVLLVLAAMLIAFGARAQSTNRLSEAEIEGRQLAQAILQERPATNLVQQGILRIEDSNRRVTTTQITFVTFVTNESWEAKYSVGQTINGSNAFIRLVIVHQNRQSSEYFVARDVFKAGDDEMIALSIPKPLNETEIMAPFADSDFWICDLGLEFFHWPDQKILKHESRRTRECAVLESTNPNPSPGTYSRVDSWIDNETLGIVHAEACDSNGKLLKVFDPKSFKKVNDQWELQDMEIRNVQTRSRTWIKFDLK